jgi:site-specific DNA recombinase
MATVEVLNKRGWRTKSFTTAEGVLVQGSRFDKFNLRSILRSPLYIGRMRSGTETFAGQHEPIVEEVIWNTTQELLTRNGRRGGCDRPNRHGVMLRGLLRCGACGSMMRHSFSGRGTTRHMYFVCAKVIEEGASACPRSRVRVDLIDGFVLDKVRAIGRDPLLARETIEAARAERERRIPELEAEVRRQEATARRAASERSRLVSAVANAGPASGTLLARVAELDQDVGDAEQRAQVARDALVEAHTGTLDEDALRAAVAEFDGIWNELFPRERARVLALLIEQVVFTGTSGDVEVHFRTNGLRSLNGDA